MNGFLQGLRDVCAARAGGIALISEEQSVTYRELWRRAAALADGLRAGGYGCAGLYRDNSVEWVVIDLACLMAEVTLVPVPTFFSDAQIRHLLAEAKVELLFIDDAVRAAKLGLRIDEDAPLRENSRVLELRAARAGVPGAAHPARITFTSGTTAEPRGVCLPPAALDAVTASLCTALAAVPVRTHLCLLPLSTLLENVAGVYAPLLMGKQVILYKGETLGLTGSSGLDVPRWIARMEAVAADSMILIPQMLHALVAARRQGLGKKLSPQFIAVGGGKVSVSLLMEARAFGWPVYEGYGLSECGSVVSLNIPGRDRPGSTGAPLPHARVRVDGGRILINPGFSTHYLENEKTVSPAGKPDWIDSGDLGYLDEGGFLYVTGRAKNVLISSFGRNISPEWLESELLHAAGFAQCAVFGDAEPFCTAVIVPQAAQRDPRQIQQALDRINEDLPDYARIRRWVLAEEAFTPANGLLTQNGRLRREAIARRYRDRLNEIYRNNKPRKRRVPS